MKKAFNGYCEQLEKEDTIKEWTGIILAGSERSASRAGLRVNGSRLMVHGSYPLRGTICCAVLILALLGTICCAVLILTLFGTIGKPWTIKNEK